MSDQNEPTCFFGLTSVRNGTRFIAKLGLVITTIAIILTVVTIIEFIIILDEDTMPSKDSTTSIIKLLLVWMVLLCLMFLSLYLSYLLMKATSDRNVKVVKIWLVLNGLSAIMSLILIFLSVLDKGTVYGQIIGLGIQIYFMSVVYRFYLQEVAADGYETI